MRGRPTLKCSAAWMNWLSMMSLSVDSHFPYLDSMHKIAKIPLSSIYTFDLLVRLFATHLCGHDHFHVVLTDLLFEASVDSVSLLLIHGPCMASHVFVCLVRALVHSSSWVVAFQQP